MTASAANGFAQVQLRAGGRVVQPVAVHVPADVLDVERAHARARGRRTRYNVAFSDEIGHFEYCTAITGEGGDCIANGEPRSTTTTGLLQPGVLAPRARSEAASPPTTTSTGPRTRTTWPGTGEAGQGHPTLDRVHEPALQRDAELLARRLRGRPAADRGRRTPAGSATGSPGRTATTRRPGSHFYPIYSTGDDEEGLLEAGQGRQEQGRGLRLAARRHRHQGHDEHVRRQLDDRVRAAAVQLLPDARTRRPGCGRTTSATCWAPTPARPDRLGCDEGACGRPRPSSLAACPRATRSIARRAGSRCSSGSGSRSRRRTRGPRRSSIAVAARRAAARVGARGRQEPAARVRGRARPAQPPAHVGRWRVAPRGTERAGRPWLVLRGAEWRGGALERAGAAARHRAAWSGSGRTSSTTRPTSTRWSRRLRGTDQARAVGDALLDQRLVAGIGNMWKAESLWRARVSPWRPLGEVADEELRETLGHAARADGASRWTAAGPPRARLPPGRPPVPALRRRDRVPRPGRRQPHRLLVPRLSGLGPWPGSDPGHGPKGQGA